MATEMDMDPFEGLSSRKKPDVKDLPRYIAYVRPNYWVACETLVHAMDVTANMGGFVYEPLGMTSAERIATPPDTVSVPVEKLREALHEFERLHDSRREADMFNGPHGDPTSSAAYAAAAGAYLHCADVIRAMLSAPLGPKGGQ